MLVLACLGVMHLSNRAVWQIRPGSCLKSVFYVVWEPCSVFLLGRFLFETTALVVHSEIFNGCLCWGLFRRDEGLSQQSHQGAGCIYYMCSMNPRGISGIVAVLRPLCTHTNVAGRSHCLFQVYVEPGTCWYSIIYSVSTVVRVSQCPSFGFTQQLLGDTEGMEKNSAVIASSRRGRIRGEKRVTVHAAFNASCFTISPRACPVSLDCMGFFKKNIQVGSRAYPISLDCVDFFKKIHGLVNRT